MKSFFNIVFSFAVLLFFNSCLLKNKGERKVNSNNEEILCRTKSMSLDYLNIKKIDTFVYEEGKVYRILTKDSSIVTFLCGNNADIMKGDDYKILDSTKIGNGGLSLRGINLKSGLFWRKDGFSGYEGVKDTLKYNKIFDNKDFIKKRSN